MRGNVGILVRSSDLRDFRAFSAVPRIRANLLDVHYVTP